MLDSSRKNGLLRENDLVAAAFVAVAAAGGEHWHSEMLSGDYDCVHPLNKNNMEKTVQSAATKRPWATNCL